ncbi:uncharacterized protein LOC115958249 isoform X1 [Quercus lobata]|uniref:Cation-transporting ATPase n=2 Tax=Quercus lobata TaxID=97700 RepID=A0A7N2MFZ7_QUELO|nr:uncharacterized protein LOC115958249 isoform X1 [Quercus lobata]
MKTKDHGERSLLIHRSDSKIVSEKRGSAGFEEKCDLSRKRIKMRDLESVCRSEGINVHFQKSLKNKEFGDQSPFGEEEMSQVTEVPVTSDLDASQAEKTGNNLFPIAVNLAHGPLDLNAEACAAKHSVFNDTQKCAENSGKLSLLQNHGRENNNICVTSRGISLDLNAEDVSSSVNQDTSYPFKIHEHSKSRDVSECGSTVEGDEDPLRRWREMKQNGFLSSSHGGIPMPKQRTRKSKSDVIKKKMELAKREQVDRFTKIAAPSGLLNGLNPGIINHVRNKKQVHSIIEALVRSEKLENGKVGSKHAAQLNSESTEAANRKDLENVDDSGTQEVSFSHDDGSLCSLSGIRHTRGYPVAMSKSGTGGHCDPSMVERICGKTCDSDSTLVSQDYMLELKLSSSNQASENAGPLPNEESAANFASSIKAADVASQWLELLHQDIKGRLSALRRSKKRVRAVITTELPFLMSKEFSFNQEKENSTDKFSNSASADMHHARWSTMFDQMEKALTEEEKQLESWLNQVKEMQLHCDQGLQHVHWNVPFGLKLLGASEIDPRSRKVDSSERELAVMAAAASIYSTSNFLLSENVCCF